MTDEDRILFQLYHIKAYDFEQTPETPLKSTQSDQMDENTRCIGKVSEMA